MKKSNVGTETLTRNPLFGTGFYLVVPGFLILALDQSLKFLTAESLRPYQSIDLLRLDFIQWTRVPNSGLVFQNFQMLYQPEYAFLTRTLPTALLVLFLVLGYLLLTRLTGITNKVLLSSLSLFWFGGLSNVVSHLRSPFVDDNISLHLISLKHVFTFNIADLGITGAIALVTYLVLVSNQTRAQALD